MASPASLPSRATSCERPPRGPEQGREEAERAVRSARARARRSARRSRASPSHRRRPHGVRAPRAAIRRSARRPAMRMRSSSVRPTSGDFSAVASVRSSSGRSAARPGGDEIEHGDVLADIEPVGAGDRHAGLLERADHGLEGRAALAHQHQHVAGASRRGPSRRPWSSSISNRPARCGAATMTGGACCSGSSTGSAQASGSSSSAGVSVGHNSTRPGALRPRALVHGADGLVLEGQALEMPRDRRRWRRPPRAPPSPERNESVSDTSSKRSSASRTFCFQLPAASSRIRAARRPGSRRSTAWDRRPRRACACARRSRPRRR